MGVGTLPAVAQTPVTSQVPVSIWDTTPSMQFDGMSTWLATFADPAAGAGQSAPVYTYFHEFGFVDSNSFGQISLDVIGGEKFASLTIVDAEEDREHRVRVPFAWTGNSFYFLWVHRLADGVWGAWAYDNTADQWSFIGALTVPIRLAKLGSPSATGVAWTGPDLENCDAYPQAVMTRRAPTGYVGSTPVQTVFALRDTVEGDCPSTVAEYVPGWDYYVVGSEPAAAAAAARGVPSNVGGSLRSYLP
ncbi:MAG: hypothetical protein ACR2HV_05730 [Acidimicrobiales bacterium]